MNTHGLFRDNRTGFGLMLVALLLAILFQGCATQTPSPCNGSQQPCFLTKKGGIPADPTETHNYYVIIDPANAKDTLDKWKRENHFPDPVDEVTAVYYNAGDLNLGRDMHCRPLDSDVYEIACYVTNYGPENPPSDVTSWFLDPNKTHALELAVSDAGNSAPQHEFATFAMEYSRPSSQENSVRFYVFDNNGDRVEAGAQLDSEGLKGIPQTCLVCHGGAYNSTSHAVTGASFLPFILRHFSYSKVPGFTRPEQEKNFLALNQIIHKANEGNAIAGLIAGIDSNGNTQNDNYVPDNDWSTNQGTKNLYISFVGDHCRSCHIAIPAHLFATYSEFLAKASDIRSDVCGKHIMPHAEVPYKKAWALGLPQSFLDANSAFPKPRRNESKCNP